MKRGQAEILASPAMKKRRIRDEGEGEERQSNGEEALPPDRVIRSTSRNSCDGAIMYSAYELHNII